MTFNDMVRSMSLSEDEARSLIAAHQLEIADTENSYLEQLSGKNRMISELQAQIDALKSAAESAKALEGRSRVYEPPVIQVVNYG